MQYRIAEGYRRGIGGPTVLSHGVDVMLDEHQELAALLVKEQWSQAA